MHLRLASLCSAGCRGQAAGEAAANKGGVQAARGCTTVKLGRLRGCLVDSQLSWRRNKGAAAAAQWRCAGHAGLGWLVKIG